MTETILVASGKGGVGKSSFTAGVSCALTDLGKKVLVIDFDIGLRSLDIILGVGNKTVYDWGDIISGNCEPSAALMETHKPTLLSAPRKVSSQYNYDSIKWLISHFYNSFDYILIDSPAGIGDGFKLAIPACNRAVVIATPDPISVRSASIAADHIRDLGLDNIRLVINRFKVKPSVKGDMLNIDEVIDSTTVRLVGIVPEDEEIAISAAKGRELLLKHSPAAAAFMRIARRIDGENIKLKLK